MLPVSGLSTELDTNRSFWGYADLVIFGGLAVAAMFLLIVALAAAVHAFPSLSNTIQLIALPAQLVFYALLFGALWLIFAIKYGQPVWRTLGWTTSRIRLWQAFAIGCVLSVAVGLLGAALHTPQIKSPFDRFLHQPVWISLFGVFAVILGPLFEELVFRGFIQPLLTRDIGDAPGILLTAAVFGLLHGKEYSWSWQYVVLVAAAGACFGYARLLGRSLVPAVFMHSGFNAIFFFAAIFGIQNHQ